MWGTGSGGNWVLLWWAGLCPVKLESNFLLMGCGVLCSLAVSCLVWGNPVLKSIGFYSRAIGGLQEDLCQDRSPRTATASDPTPVASHCRLMPLQKTLRHSQVVLARSPVGWLLLFPGTWGAQDFVCPLQESLFPPVLWELCNQILLAFTVRSPGDSQSLGQISRLWGLELSQQFENFFWLIILQFLSRPPGRYRIWFYSNCPPPYRFVVASHLSLDVGYLFLVGSSVFLSMVV